MKFTTVLIAALVLFSGCGQDQPEQQVSISVDAKPYDFTYADYGWLLNHYVVDGRVDYAGLQADRSKLDSLVARLATADLKDATQDQKLAFYINAYNMLVLRSVIDAYPVATIKDIEGIFDAKEWIVAGAKVTLNDIEYDILGKKFKEPRFHMAISCGTRGCPPLVSQPYLAQNLSDQLQLVSQYFSVNEQYNRIDPATGVAELSLVFKWIGEELIPGYYDNGLFSNLCKEENAAVTFVIKHHPAEEQGRLFASDYQLSFRDYDWRLNELR